MTKKTNSTLYFEPNLYHWKIFKNTRCLSPVRNLVSGNHLLLLLNSWTRIDVAGCLQLQIFVRKNVITFSKLE